MTWSYNVDQLATSSRDQLRFIVGDTDQDKPLLQDEELDYLLSQHITVNSAAPYAAESIAAFFAKKSDKTVGTLSIQYKTLHDNYVEFAKRLRQRLKVTVAGAPFLSGGGDQFLGPKGNWQRSLVAMFPNTDCRDA